MKKTILVTFTLLQFALLFSQDKNYSEWYLQREDVEVFVKEIGTGKDTVIVVHGGFGANHDYMLDAINGLHKKYHFVFYDQRGSLMSPTKKENLTFQKNVGDLYALISELQLKKAKIFCHSMGTLVGMEFTKQHPDRVSHLVLAGAVLPKADSLQSIFSEKYHQHNVLLENRKEVKQLLAPFKAKGVDSLKSIKDIRAYQFSHKELTDFWRIKFASVNLFDVSKYHLLKGGKAYFKNSASAMSETVDWNYDYRSVLNNIKTTIINGDHDFFDFNGEEFRPLLKSYDNIELKIIPDAGHSSWVDKPKLFQKFLKKALKK